MATFVAFVALPSVVSAGLVAARIYRGPGNGDDGFGEAVSGVGVTFGVNAVLAVGAPRGRVLFGPDDAGVVHLFHDLYATAPDLTIESHDPEAAGHFGSALAPIGPNLANLLVGAPGESVSGVAGAGRVQVVRPNGEPILLPHPAPKAGSAFGSAVAAAGTLALIGAPAPDDQADHGRAYLVDPATKVSTLLPHTGAAASLFGAAVAAATTPSERVVAFVGAPFEEDGGRRVGMVYAYDATPASPTFGTLLRTIRNPVAPAGQQDAFGHALATDNGLLIVGAPLADVDKVSGAGKAYVFDGDPDSPRFGEPLRTIPHPHPTTNASFGAAVLLVPAVIALPDTIAIGAPFDDPIANGAEVTDGGAVYLFDGDREHSTFTQQLAHSPLINPAATNYARLGLALALIGTGAEGLDGVRNGGDVAAAAPGNARLAAEGAVVVLANCGNNIAEGEECDDGNEESGDGCSDLCKQEALHCDGRLASALIAADSIPSKQCPCDDPVPTCDDGIECTVDVCLGPGELCQSAPDPSRCPADSDACIQSVCDPVVGCVKKPRSCDDQDPCTDDSCDPLTGCRHVTANCPCDDARDCNPCRGETCERCPACDDWYPDRECCKVASCQADGAQVQLSVTPCNDHQPCTDKDVCVAFDVCKGTLVTDPINVVSACGPAPACTVAICRENGCGLESVDGCPGPSCPNNCVDDDACTADICGPGGCTNPRFQGVMAVSCLFKQPIATCAPEEAKGARAAIGEARKLVDNAEGAEGRTRRKFVKKALHKLKVARMRLAAQRGIARECRIELRDYIRATRKEASTWLQGA